jgi:hypothetical protein
MYSNFTYKSDMKIFSFLRKNNNDALKIASHMLNTENGKKMWDENGEEIKNPVDNTKYMTDFCDIYMHSNTANIYMIIPNGDIAFYIEEFIRAVNSEFYKLQPNSQYNKIRPTKFSYEESPAIDCRSSILTNSDLLLNRRLYSYNNTNSKLCCNFEWDIQVDFSIYEFNFQSISDWFVLTNSIIIDFTGIYTGEQGRIIPPMMYVGDLTTLKECNIIPHDTIELLKTCKGGIYPLSKNHKYRNNSLKENRLDICDYTNREDEKDAKYTFVSFDFSELHLNSEKINSDIECQFCKLLIYGDCISCLEVSPGTMITLCDICFYYENIVKQISEQYKPCIINFSRPLNDVSEKNYGHSSSVIVNAITLANNLSDDTTSNEILVKSIRTLCMEDIQDIVNFRMKNKNGKIAILHYH